MIINRTNSNYRWYILVLTMAVSGLLGGAARNCMPVLFKEISVDLGLSIVQIGTVWGMDPLAGVFIGLPGGMLADRFGIKRTITVICILAGIFGALRGFSVNFLTMAASMFLFGLTIASTPGVVPKVTAVWFSGKRLGLANALLNVSWSIGSMTATLFSATVFSPWLGSWRAVMFLYGIPGVLLGLLWLFTGREPEKHELPETSVKSVPLLQAISKVARMKEVWVVGLITFTHWGANTGFFGYFPLYLRNIGWTPAAADSALTSVMAASSLGIIPMVLLSDKIRSRKKIFALSALAQATSFILIPFLDGAGVWISVILLGFVRSAGPSLVSIMVFEVKGVGSEYAGTAIGLATTIAMIGAFIAPPLGNSLTAFSLGYPLIFWGILAAMSLPLLPLLKSVR